MQNHQCRQSINDSRSVGMPVKGPMCNVRSNHSPLTWGELFIQCITLVQFQ